MKTLFAAFGLALCLSAFSQSSVMPIRPSDDFRIAVVPDSQFLSTYTADVSRWLRTNRLGLSAVVHVGDLVDNAATTAQWYNATNWLETWRANIPFLPVAGNHDYSTFATKTLTHFASYFPSNPSSGITYRTGSANDKSTWRFRTTKGQTTYCLIGLEPFPGQDALAFVTNSLTTYSNDVSIVFTHAWLMHTGKRSGAWDRWGSANYGLSAPGSYDAETAWHSCLKHFPNLVAIFSGHDLKGYGTDYSARQDSVAADGHIVHEIFANWQEPQNVDPSTNAQLRIVTLNPVKNTFKVETFNPLAAAAYQTFTNEQDRFTLPLWTSTPTATGNWLTNDLLLWLTFDSFNGNYLGFTNNMGTSFPPIGTNAVGTNCIWTNGITTWAVWITNAGNIYFDDHAALSAASYMTVAAWVRIGAGAGSGNVIAAKHKSGNDSEWMLKLTDSSGASLTFSVCTNVSFSRVNFLAPPSPWIHPQLFNGYENSWHHVAATYSLGEMKVYLDGACLGTNQIPRAAMPDTAHALTVGCYRDELGLGASGFKLLGAIDDFRYYMRALKPEEILSLYRLRGSTYQTPY